MRNLNTADLFCAARAIKRSGLRDTMKQAAIKAAHATDVEDIGVDTILSIIECFAESGAEQAVYEVLAGPFEMSPEEISALGLTELMDCIEQLAKDPGMKDFFARLSGLIRSN